MDSLIQVVAKLVFTEETVNNLKIKLNYAQITSFSHELKYWEIWVKCVYLHLFDVVSIQVQVYK